MHEFRKSTKIQTLTFWYKRNEAFTKNYSTGTVWDPPLWIPYSSMALGAILMILQYIAEIIKLTDDKDYN